ncbi:MAG: hypothetical protein V1729_02060 [Candidatus Woesearchaeota archaeon]
MGDIVDLRRYLKKGRFNTATEGAKANVFYIDDAFKDKKQKIISALEKKIDGTSALVYTPHPPGACEAVYGSPLDIAAMARWHYDEHRYSESMQCVDCLIESGPQEKNELIALFDLVQRLYGENRVQLNAVGYLIKVCSVRYEDDVMMQKRLADIRRVFRPFMTRSIHLVRDDWQKH